MTNLQELLFLPIFLILLIISVIVHEISHGKMAEVLGDPTARNMGRLTFNPIKHIDPFGSVLLPFLMFFSTRMLIGYAKPVPIDPRYFKNPQKGMALTAFAGPLSNFTMAAVVGLFIKLGIVSIESLEGSVVYMFVAINVLLGSFNLVPIPPLDGSKIFAAFLPKSSLYTYYRLERYGMLILFGLLIFFPQILAFYRQYFITPLTGFFI